MYFELFNLKLTISERKAREIKDFLTRNQLNLDHQIEIFVIIRSQSTDEILACGGLSCNIIKCVAIDRAAQGEGLALKLITELTNLAYERGRTQLFIYTKPEYEKLFNSCGFHTISSAYPNVVLLENSAKRIKKYCQSLSVQKVVGDRIGAIVMNANPFTLGHRYLIEQALQQCDHLHIFVVGENASLFSYQERFNLVELGIRDLQRITLHAGSDYIISRATFPNYFLKDQGLTEDLYLELDLKIFRRYIAPALGITHRFVGSEPICAVTALYNEKMHHWLSDAEMASPGIQVVELARKVVNEQPISASRVRALWQEQNWTELACLVVKSTLDFLKQRSLNLS
ncbi:[citrate (pro-3S)-lyase] ligase [Pasteurellaceae bacterium Macca]|nr:[citrate (pro-3S)-lyase] ligase [Pasteurellaceae bacterium Macca]